MSECECWVCGSTTTTMCSTCRQEDPGILIYYCSKRCQRIVYPAHRKVCGKNANPFTIPPLNKFQLDEAKKNLFQQFPVHAQLTPICIDRSIRTSLEAKLSRFGYNNVNRDLSDSIGTSDYRTEQMQLVICLIRHCHRSRILANNAVSFTSPHELALQKTSQVLPVLHELSYERINSILDPTGVATFLYRFLHFTYLIEVKKNGATGEVRALAATGIETNYGVLLDLLQRLNDIGPRLVQEVATHIDHLKYPAPFDIDRQVAKIEAAKKRFGSG